MSSKVVFSQNEWIIIGMSADSILFHDLGDVVIESPDNSYQDYTIDIDDNGEWDFKFKSKQYGGGFGDGGSIDLKSNDSTFFHRYYCISMDWVL